MRLFPGFDPYMHACLGHLCLDIPVCVLQPCDRLLPSGVKAALVHRLRAAALKICICIQALQQSFRVEISPNHSRHYARCMRDTSGISHCRSHTGECTKLMMWMLSAASGRSVATDCCMRSWTADSCQELTSCVSPTNASVLCIEQAWIRIEPCSARRMPPFGQPGCMRRQRTHAKPRRQQALWLTRRRLNQRTSQPACRACMQSAAAPGAASVTPCQHTLSAAHQLGRRSTSSAASAAAAQPQDSRPLRRVAAGQVPVLRQGLRVCPAAAPSAAACPHSSAAIFHTGLTDKS